jgi:hypothetical protein
VVLTPGDYWWRVEWWNDTGETGPHDVWYPKFVTSGGTGELNSAYRRGEDDVYRMPFPAEAIADGKTVQLRVHLEQPQGIVIDAGNRQVLVDWKTSAPWLLQSQTPVSGQGGLTTQQALQLETTTAAMGFAIGGGWTNLVGDLLNVVGRKFFNDVLITPDRTDEGLLTPPAEGLFGIPFGIQWLVVSAPPGIGIDEGVPDRTEINWGQLSYMHNSDIGLTLSDTRYCDELQGRWMWGAAWPDSLAYFIMPGITVRFWWIVINVGAPLELQGGLELARERLGEPDSK